MLFDVRAGGYLANKERTGDLPIMQFIKLFKKNECTQKDIEEMLRGLGVFISYLGTADMREVERMAMEHLECCVKKKYRKNTPYVITAS